jgi:PAS domain S-box-containing protein
MSLFSNWHLNTRLNVILALIFLALLASNAVDDYFRQQSLILRDAVDSSRMMARQIVETRNYLSSVIKDEARTNNNLIPQVAATRIALLITKEGKYNLRQVSLRYRNPANSPDQYETEQLKMFAGKKANESYNVITVNGEKVFRYLLPMVAEKSCLECHGSYETAPLFIQQRFPSGHFSYNYVVGDVIGAVSVSIPMAELYRTIGRNLRSDLIYSGSLVFLVILLLAWLSRRFIVTPVQNLSATITSVARTGNFSKKLPVRGNDEISQLITSYNDMMTELDHRIIQRQESEERYRNVMEMAQSAVVTFLRDGKMVIVNSTAEQLFGMSKNDLIGTSFYDFLVEGDQFRQEIESHLQPDQSMTGTAFTTTFRDIRGQKRQMELSLSATQSGEHPMFTVIIREAEKG